MNITFMFGNGFDIGLGLKTSYKDFYDFFIKNASENNQLRLAIQADKKQYKNWSDLERSLGEYTQKVSVENWDKFKKDKIEMDKCLMKYLKGEEEKFKYEEDRLYEFTKGALQKLRYIGCSLEEKQKIENILERYSNHDYNYFGITFNYTRCLDEAVKTIKKKGNCMQTHTSKKSNGTYGEYIKDIIHIHGELDDGEMILGVNDESQINNQEILQCDFAKILLIKPELNKALGQQKIERATDIINNSGIICIYGMSLGITDKMWWNILCQWLAKDKDNILIIFEYSDDYSNIHPVEKITFTENLKEEFLSLGDFIQEKDRKPLKNQIIVHVKQNIFEKKCAQEHDETLKDTSTDIIDSVI